MAVCIPMRPIPMNLYTKSAGCLTYADSGNLVAMGDYVTLLYSPTQNGEEEYKGRVTGANYGEDGSLIEIAVADDGGGWNYFEMSRSEVAEG